MWGVGTCHASVAAGVPAAAAAGLAQGPGASTDCSALAVSMWPYEHATSRAVRLQTHWAMLRSTTPTTKLDCQHEVTTGSAHFRATGQPGEAARYGPARQLLNAARRIVSTLCCPCSARPRLRPTAPWPPRCGREPRPDVVPSRCTANKAHSMRSGCHERLSP